MPRRILRAWVIDPEKWQTTLLTAILRVSAFLGLLVYIPSMAVALRAGLAGVAVLDTLTIAIVIALYFCERLPFVWRATLYCSVCYVLAVGLMISIGSISQIYLFGFSILATILLGLRAGIAAALMSSATLLAIGLLGHAAPEMMSAFWNFDFAGWMIITLNFTFINTLLTLAIGTVLAALNNALKREVAARSTLERERKLLRTLFDALPDIVFTKDTEGRFVNANPAALAQFGFEREEQLAGKSVFDFFPRELAEAYRTDDLNVIAGQPLLDREERGLDREGKPIWFLTIKVPLRDANGAIIGLIGICRDITSRKKSEAERSRLLAQLQLQIERMPLAYLLTDADFRYIRWNPAAERMFGFAEAEVLGKRPFDVIVPQQSQTLVSSIFEKIKAGNMEAHGESENCTKDRGTILCEWYNTPMFDEHGDFAGLLSLAQNITDRKNLEGALRQSQKMDAVGRLAGGVAHDFNNLLTVINGHSEILLALPALNAGVRDSVKAISAAGERAAGLTRQLLSFSRQTILQPKVLDLNAVVADTVMLLRRLIGEDILLATTLAPDLRRVKVDPSQLDQVLMNLAVNARDAMPKGGRLTIETANVDLGEDCSATHLGCHAGPHVMLVMTDTGCGMTPEVLARIFEPFYTTKEVGKGTGLGMAMVFGIMQQSGGCINATSKPGVGTTITIYFPAVSEPAAKKEAADPKIAVGGTETILLVEDEDAVRRLVVANLQIHGYNVLTAIDGKDALHVMQSYRGPLHLILTDVVMPNINGPEMVATLREQFPDVKALFMSGYTDDDVIRHGLLEADVSFIQKPFTPVALRHKIRQVLDEKALGSK